LSFPSSSGGLRAFFFNLSGGATHRGIRSGLLPRSLPGTTAGAGSWWQILSIIVSHY
jgi:hypothetical protein